MLTAYKQKVRIFFYYWVMKFSGFFYFFLFIMLHLFYGCKKEKDHVPPVIKLISPEQGKHFQIPDAIDLKLIVEDDVNIEFVRIELVDENMKPVHSPRVTYPEKTKAEIENFFLLNDEKMPGGTYFVRVTAFDGVNESKIFRKIYINEVERKRKGFFVISGSGSILGVNVIDSSGQLNYLYQINSDYSGSSVCSFYQLLTVAGKNTGGINGYSIKTNTLKWNMPSSNHPFIPTFMGLGYFNKLNYVSYYDGQIRAVNEIGGFAFSAQSYNSYYSEKFYVNEGHLIVSQKEISGDKRKIVTYHKTSGAIVHHSIVNGEVVGFERKSKNEIYVFLNNGNQGEIWIYETEKNNLWRPLNVPLPKFNHTCQVNENFCLIATDNGVLSYSYQPNGVFDFVEGIKADLILYDDLEREVIVVTDNSIQSYYIGIAGNSIFKSSVPHGGGIRAIHAWYNK
jgi:hypothetical protein